MKRRKLLSLVFCVSNVLVFCCCEASQNNAQHKSSTVNKFQSAIQQQNTYTILASIEERLRNLDNVYSMQLSQSLDVKLDQYNRKLEMLDSKIMRLEAMVMLNLGKISENISTKIFKDDIEETNTYRKLDSIYESIIHRMSYAERKYELNFGKIQDKADITTRRLEKIEENLLKRNSDFEAELSDAIYAIDDLKTTYTTMEKKILNITEAALNVSKANFNLLSKTTVEDRKSLNKLHDNIIGNLQYIDNKTSEHFKISDDSNAMLKKMKVELKEDFNNYANKVADMNSDMWKKSDTTEGDLKTIALVVNNTKEEVQNGVRALMLQIGKVSNKDIDIPLDTSNRYEEFDRKLNDNFEKILTNQDVFLQSCYRLQKDESQIETEISTILNKLIDMLEKRLGSESKDIRNLEKSLKNHDSRTNRNLYQANQNIMSLFEKSTVNTQTVTNEIKKVNSDLNALFSFVQSTLPEASPLTSMNKRMMMDKLENIENFARNMSTALETISPHSQFTNNVTHNQIYREIQKLSRSLSSSIGEINNNTRDTCLQRRDVGRIADSISKKYFEKYPKIGVLNEKLPLTEPEIDNATRAAIIRVFGPGPNVKQGPSKRRKCKPRSEDLMDIRAGIDEDCEESEEMPDAKLSEPTKKPKRKKKKFKIDIRAESNSGADNPEDEEYDSSTEDADVEETTYKTTGIPETEHLSESTPLGTEKNDDTSTYYSET